MNESRSVFPCVSLTVEGDKERKKDEDGDIVRELRIPEKEPDPNAKNKVVLYLEYTSLQQVLIQVSFEDVDEYFLTLYRRSCMNLDSSRYWQQGDAQQRPEWLQSSHL